MSQVDFASFQPAVPPLMQGFAIASLLSFVRGFFQRRRQGRQRVFQSLVTDARTFISYFALNIRVLAPVFRLPGSTPRSGKLSQGQYQAHQLRLPRDAQLPVRLLQVLADAVFLAAR